MIRKEPLDTRRLRTRPPPGFGWLDHRLLRQGYLARCAPPAWALYCLLVCASDGQGLSFYGAVRLEQMLQLAPAALRQARGDLLRLGLIAYREPLYQVLTLEPTPVVEPLHTLPKALPGQADAARPSTRVCAPPAAQEGRPTAAAAGSLDLRAMVERALVDLRSQRDRQP
jgi:hypothetical protein